jgi:hypothetical protein
MESSQNPEEVEEIKNPFRDNPEYTVKKLRERCRSYYIRKYSKMAKQELADALFHHISFNKHIDKKLSKLFYKSYIINFITN